MKKIEIDGIKDYYYITDSGVVYSDFSGNLKERVPEIDQHGYKRIALSTESSKLKKFLAHRLVAIFYIDNPLNLPVVNHKDANKLNNHYKNLEWTTVQGNVDHAYENGLVKAAAGEDHYQTTIDNATAVEIYKSYLKGVSNSAAMSKYGISRGTAERIRNRRIFKDVLDPLPACKPSKPKIKDDDVRFICQTIQNNPELSARLIVELVSCDIQGITLGSVSKIKARKSYTHISSFYNW